MSRTFDAVVLAGGTSRRMGGVDKTALVVGGRTVLDGVLAACAGARAVVVVGPARPLRRRVIWARERPPGGGPLAALAAGLAALPLIPGTGGAGDARTDRRPDDVEPAPAAALVVVLAGDLAHVDSQVVRRLIDAAAPPFDGAAVRDRAGRLQPLVAAYRREPLGSALAGIGDAAGRPVSMLLDRLQIAAVDDDRASFDIDTPQDLAAIEREHWEMEDWVRAVRAALGIEQEIDVQQLLDVARDVAHNVERPAAPVTTFLVGFAAAQRGGSAEAVADASGAVTELALSWGERSGDAER